jgi:hypothetical protein
MLVEVHEKSVRSAIFELLNADKCTDKRGWGDMHVQLQLLTQNGATKTCTNRQHLQFVIMSRRRVCTDGQNNKPDISSLYHGYLLALSPLSLFDTTWRFRKQSNVTQEQTNKCYFSLMFSALYVFTDGCLICD